MPGIVFVAAFMLSAACGSEDAPPANPVCNDNSSENAGAGAGETTATSGSGAGPSTQVTPQEVAARLHGCRKLRYEALGDLLADRGVDTSNFGGSGNNCQTDGSQDCPQGEQCYCANPPCFAVGNNAPSTGTCVTAPATAGFLYTTGADAFGVPGLDSRRGEKDGHTTASAMRLFDVFIQAAPQIVANIDNAQMAPACSINGQTWPMFDAGDGSCVEESVSCLIGMPATEDHLLLCNLIVEKASPNDPTDLDRKRHIAVATLLSAAHTCE